MTDPIADYLTRIRNAAKENYTKALNHYQKSLTGPSAIIKDPKAIRKDALYYTAWVRDKLYEGNSSPETRLQALTAWNALKKEYRDTPNHPRFKQANKKLATSY